MIFLLALSAKYIHCEAPSISFMKYGKVIFSNFVYKPYFWIKAYDKISKNTRSIGNNLPFTAVIVTILPQVFIVKAAINPR